MTRLPFVSMKSASGDMLSHRSASISEIRMDISSSSIGMQYSSSFAAATNALISSGSSHAAVRFLAVCGAVIFLGKGASFARRTDLISPHEFFTVFVAYCPYARSTMPCQSRGLLVSKRRSMASWKRFFKRVDKSRVDSVVFLQPISEFRSEMGIFYSVVS